MDKKNESSNVNRTVTQERFVVGSSKATYVNGKSRMSLATLSLELAKKSVEYMAAMGDASPVVYELVPVLINPDGTINRQT